MRAVRLRPVPLRTALHNEYGIEAQFCTRNWLVIARLFQTKLLAVQWAEEERKYIENGGDE